MAGGYETTLNPNESQPNASSGFNMDLAQKTFGAQAQRIDENLKVRLESMDPNSTQDMINFQVEFNKYMIVEGLNSSLMKSLKDTLQNIISKI